MPVTGLYLGAFHLTNKAGGVEVFAEGTDFGNPEPELVVIESLLQDGDLVEYTRSGNRVQSIRVVLTGSVATKQANEVALLAELHKRNTLTVPPLEVGGFTIVFDVVDASLNQIPDDLAEVQQGEWHYSLSITSLPFGRSVTEVVAPALAASGATTTLVDNGSSTTGWTAEVNGVSSSPSVVSGAVTVTSGALAGVVSLVAIRAGSITTSSTKYIAVDWRCSTESATLSASEVGGNSLEKIAEFPSATPGTTTTVFYWSGASISGLLLGCRSIGPEVGGGGPATPTVRTFSVDNINRTDVTPSLGTGRQLVRTVAVAGSARTQGALAVEHSSSALGDALVYVSPDDGSGFAPALRRFRVSGDSVTADATKLSGSRNTLAGGDVYDVPARYLPSSRYLLMARIATTGYPITITYTFSAQMRINGTNVGPVAVGSGTNLVAFTTDAFAPIGRLILPPADVGNRASATVRINLQGADSNLDDLYLFDLDRGALVIVPCGSGAAASGGPSRRLFILPPTVETGRPRVLRGHAADGSDAFYPSDMQSWGDVEFVPPSMSVFTATTNAQDASVSLRHFPRWHSHAGTA